MFLTCLPRILASVALFSMSIASHAAPAKGLLSIEQKGDNNATTLSPVPCSRDHSWGFLFHNHTKLQKQTRKRKKAKSLSR